MGTRHAMVSPYEEILMNKANKIKRLKDQLAYAEACYDNHTEYECIKGCWEKDIIRLKALIKKARTE